MKKSIVRAQVLEAIGNAKSFEMLTLITKNKDSKTKDLISQVRISRREYYGRMSKFLDTGLIARMHGKWLLTTAEIFCYLPKKLT